MSEVQNSITPDFELTAPLGPPSKVDFLIAEFERKFGGKAVPVKSEKQWPEFGEPGSNRIERQLEEPEWERYINPQTGKLGFRAQVAKLLWERGLRKKSLRFLNCNKCARPGQCRLYPLEHKFFIPNGCEVDFCKECADVSRRELLVAYLPVVGNAVLDFAGERGEYERLCGLLSKASGLERESAERRIGHLWERVAQCLQKCGYVLWRVNFTLRSDGSEITPERVKAMNNCIGKVMNLAVRFPWRKSGSEAALPLRKRYGLFFIDEVGFESRGHLPDEQRVAHGLNLHAHGLYFGPGLDWERTRDLWKEVTKEKFGVESFGFFYRSVRGFIKNPERAIRWALNHMLKYVSKPPAVSPERLASLIAAFDTTRRVHALGLFYGKRPKQKKHDCPCPQCRAMGIVSTVEFEGRPLAAGGCLPRICPIDELIADGYVLLREAGRDAVLSMAEARSP